MEHVLTYCDHVVVVDNGHIAQTCDKQQFFKDSTLLKKLRINPPAVIRLRDELNQRGFSLPCDLLDMDTLAKAIADEVKDHE